VILFDEFDSILLDRAIRKVDQVPTSVIEFLTPGMLPKLKALNSASKTGRMSYVLATNFLDRIDGAVQRGGRFDEKCGIYPPDLVSRLGRLVDQFRKYQRQLDKKVDDNSNTTPDVIEKKLADRLKDHCERIVQAVNKTRGGSMDKLGKPGWYSMPGDKKTKEISLFDEVLHGTSIEEIKPEAEYTEDLAKYKEQHLDKKKVEESPYWRQWNYVNDWDDQFKTATSSNWTEVNAFIKRVMEASEHVEKEAKRKAGEKEERLETRETEEPRKT
jgi:SpoVK/Ycf46/Vps4 family AAA+-type ATPase